jgi:hypothetical protein
MENNHIPSDGIMLNFVFGLCQKYIHITFTLPKIKNNVIHNTDFYFKYKGTDSDIFNYCYLVMYQTQNTKMLKITTKIQKLGQHGVNNLILTHI